MSTAAFLLGYAFFLAAIIYFANAVGAVIMERDWRARMVQMYGADLHLPPMWKIFLTCGLCKR